MPDLYSYKARDRNGDLVSGSIRGETALAVESYLESLDFIPVKISIDHGFQLRNLAKVGRSKPKLDDMILVTRKLSTLYRAGIPILRSLEIVSEQYHDAKLGTILLTVRDDLQRGEGLSEAMAKHPKVFTNIYVSSVKAAEASGKLDVVLDKLAEAMEQELVTREDVKKAVRYPITVLIAIAVAFVVLTTFVIPKFTQFYSSYGAELPKPTQILLFVSRVFRQFWYVIFPGIIAAVIGFIKFIKHPKMKPVVDSMILKIPVIGNLLVKTALSRFSHLLGVLTASGTPLIQSLDIVRQAVGNEVIGREVGRLIEGLRSGRSLAESRHHMRHFPRLAISLIHVGLESGTLDLTLKEICRFFDREVQYTSSRLTSLLEPLIIIVIAGMVLLLALAVFLPMWNLISVFRG
jgi:type II secretory pathway component PulF